jgi:hypothetical protein
MRYFQKLTAGGLALWCYFVWYAFFAVRYFDPSRALWLTSLGLAIIVGVALMISTSTQRLWSWQAFRLFAMPFFVSSFSALVKGRGFMLIFSPRLQENYIALGCVAAFCAFVGGVKFARQ